MSKSYIVYKDVAPFIEEDASVDAQGVSSFSNPSLLPQGKNPGKIRTLELNQWVLDGEHVGLNNKQVALWSNELSGDDCKFLNVPVIDIQFSQQHASVGLTLIFDEADGNFCTEIDVKWYQGSTLKAEATFYPDSVSYFAQKKVSAFTRIVITLKETSLPHRRAKLNHIIFGAVRRFDMESLRSVKIINQTDLLSAELPVSTMDIVLESRDDIDFMFQLKQQLEAWNNDNLIGVYYIDEYERSGRGTYSISSNDAIGVLDESTFAGGYYSNQSAKALLQSIVSPHFTIDTLAVADVLLSGILEPDTCRAAMQQVLFAAGWVMRSDGGKEIKVFTADETLSEIGENRTYTGAKTTSAAIVTSVQVIAHTYTQSDSGSIEINGVKYEQTDTTYTVDNPDIVVTDKPNIKVIKDATLVSPDIGQATAQRVYNYYLNRQTNSAKVVWDGEILGDYVSLPTIWGTAHKGHIQKMTITLSNTVAADLETLGNEETMQA